MDLEKYRKYFNETNEFVKWYGGQVTKLQQGYATVEVQVQERFRNVNNSVHGGLLYSLADTAVGVASKTFGKATVTLNGHLDFIKPVLINGQTIVARAKAVHAGKRTGVYLCKIYDNKKIVAEGSFTMYVLDDDLKF